MEGPCKYCCGPHRSRDCDDNTAKLRHALNAIMPHVKEMAKMVGAESAPDAKPMPEKQMRPQGRIRLSCGCWHTDDMPPVDELEFQYEAWEADEGGSYKTVVSGVVYCPECQRQYRESTRWSTRAKEIADHAVNGGRGPEALIDMIEKLAWDAFFQGKRIERHWVENRQATDRSVGCSLRETNPAKDDTSPRMPRGDANA